MAIVTFREILERFGRKWIFEFSLTSDLYWNIIIVEHIDPESSLPWKAVLVKGSTTN